MTCYSIEPRTTKYINGDRFLPSTRNLSNKYRKKICNTAIKTGTDPPKTADTKPIKTDAVKWKIQNIQNILQNT